MLSGIATISTQPKFDIELSSFNNLSDTPELRCQKPSFGGVQVSIRGVRPPPNPPVIRTLIVAHRHILFKNNKKLM